MSTPGVSSEPKKNAFSRPLVRSEETFWQHYSPHHEFPVATVSAITLCGVALGLLFLLWLLGGLNLNNDADAPPRTDAVTIAGPEGGGGGSDGLGTGATALAAPKTELGQNELRDKPPVRRLADPAVPLPDDLKASPLTPASPLEFTPPLEDATPFADLQKTLSKVEMENKIAEERAKARKAVPRGTVAGSGGPPGGRNSSGSGGGSGGGYGSGVGPGTGPGRGSTFGRTPTKQEIHANRWQFIFYSDPEQHVQKLIAMGANYYVTHPNRSFYKVQDLRRRPVVLVPASPINSQDAVTWHNRDVISLRGLASILKLSFIPLQGTITLPADVEEKIAAVEREAMEKAGRREETVRFTHFDMRLVGGVYEPYVIRFE